jgi:hypothetical protein
MDTTPLWARERRDRGSATIEALIATVLVAALISFIFQMCVWAHAHHMAAAAAQVALATGRAEDGTAASASGTGAESLGRNAGGSLTDAQITVAADGETVTVTVTGEAASLIPGLDLPVEATAQGPVERFVPQEGD